MARMDSAPDFYCLACEDVTIENYTMRIWHYLCRNRNNPMVVWVFNRITMTVLCNTSFINGPRIHWHPDERGRESVRVFHDSPHLLVVPNLAEGGAFHCGMDGRCLAGSNTWPDGKLCLGDGFAPYDFSAVHLLCNFNANADLGWRGPVLTIRTPIENHQRTVIRWPNMNNTSRVEIPREIAGFFNR